MQAAPVSVADASGASSGRVSTAPQPNIAPVKSDEPVFDADHAFALLKKQCDFGSRYLGTNAHAQTLDYLQSEMRKYADSTVTQSFNYRGLPVTNVIGVFYPAGSTKPAKHPVMLMAHWDTRPIADGPFSSELQKGRFVYGSKGWNRLAPIPGANDGASGVAVLLELAKMFKQKHPPVGVILLLDDGEDYGDFRANGGQGEGVELGARYFARHYSEDPRFGHPDFGILLDMIGGKNLLIQREANSQRYAPGPNEKVFGVAKSLGYGNTFSETGEQEIDDDHISLNREGHIPTIDLICPLPNGNPDYGYVYWHTQQDDPDKCDPKSLKIVGDTVAKVIYEETPEPN